ncbi:MAG: DUF1109 family protein [Gluconacetobacter diazotrophicus]|nr:DUF1109 family protein [Gluconacetobacter diazotrophicus]
MSGDPVLPAGPAADHALVERLATALRPVRRRTLGRDAALLAAIGATELLLFLLFGGMRPDMHRAMAEPTWWWKLGSMAAVALAGGASATVSLDPSRAPRFGARTVVALLLGCVALGWLLDSARFGIGPLLDRLDWRQGIGCVWKMAALSIPAVLGFGLLLRRGAPSDHTGTAWAAGIAAAAWGAFVFVFACPSDDPLYVAVWYAVGLGIVSAASRLVFGRLARW